MLTLKGDEKAMPQDIRFSIIIPCYNVAEYIPICLDSILKNNMRDGEIILVDDGSTDNFDAVCANYLGVDSISTIKSFSIDGGVEIHIVKQNNKGVSAARNKGISEANGDILLFVDPDDTVPYNWISEIRKKFDEYKYDMVLFGYNQFCEDSTECSVVLPHTEYDVFSNGEIVKEVFPNFYGYSVTHVKNYLRYGIFNSDKEWGAVWRAAYRYSFIKKNGVSFNEKIILNEDGIFNMWCFVKAESVGVINKPLYNYFLRDSGSMSQAKKNRLMDNKTYLLDERAAICSYLQKKGQSVSIRDYAGSNVFSVLELMAQGQSNGYNGILPYIKRSEIQESIRLVPMGKKLRYTVPVILLKIHGYRILWMIFRIFQLIGVKINV